MATVTERPQPVREMGSIPDGAIPDPTPDAIMHLGLGFWGSKTLLSAVELGVFTELAKDPLAADALIARLGLHPGARDFLDALVALHMLDRRDGKYANTPATDRFLDRAKPTYVGDMLETANARLYAFWGRLTDALRTGHDSFALPFGDGVRLQRFLHGMTGLSAAAGAAVARKLSWQGYETFADIGTGEGGLPVSLAARHAHLIGIGFDRPPVRPLFQTYVEAHGLEERVRFEAGDFFRDPLPRADVLLMGHVLRDWSLAEKRLLLAEAHGALPAGGALVVYDTWIDDESRERASGYPSTMTETARGFDYTGADCMSWMRHAGFRDIRMEHLAGPDAMVVGVK